MSFQNMSYGGYQGASGVGTGYPGGQPGSGYPGGQPGSGYPGSQNSAGYGGGQQMGYGGAPGINPEIQQWFSAVDRDKSGRISASELQAALVTGHGKNFSETACKLMIGMFDQDHSGTIDLKEFQSLYNYINGWLATFRSYDKDGSGSIEEGELSQALQQIGFRFSPQFIKYLIDKNDVQNHKSITVDQFIVSMVQIQKFTDAFRARDTEMKGTIVISFEDFMSVALSCNV